MTLDLNTQGNIAKIGTCEVHLPNGEVAPLSEVIEACPYTLDFNLLYFYKIIQDFVALDISHKDYHFLLTRRVDELPQFPSDKLQNLIVFLLGDEWCRTPSYASDVLAVFKCYGSTPTLEFHQSNLYLNSLILLQYIRVVFKGLKTWGVKSKNVFPFPLGYFRQSDLPTVPILERTCDVSFIGSLKNSPKQGLLKMFGFFKSPKIVSRQSMVSCVSKWQGADRYNVDVRLTSSFPHAEKTSEFGDYSERLMNTKICLSPRGTSLETFRYFEALRYGCILVSEPVPNYWFYKDSPAIYLNDWNKLPQLLESLLGDTQRLEELHHKALNWWQNRCSPSAVSSQMFHNLK
ncbi:glycosyltransferase family 47 protein [Mastigocoleus testarum]|uniref:RXYLT1 C-terminal domain-containing protein n=1 Tax=Mastigocoleus testarum BC008 TaxID=371196 RepID=A0A0V7ZPI1_9CYAN|nr:hypothetical protein [Mastigocoleus testarum]KST66492.1 hypothetical protein BC008_42945 [Mastigocoleus testarum BC008]